MSEPAGTGEALQRPVLDVDLDAMLANWRTLVAAAAPAELAAVVKADAYGLGLRQIAPFLWAGGAKTFFVARLDEALTLRRVLPKARIFVLDGLQPGGVELFVRHRIDPVLNQPGDLATWRAAAHRHDRQLPTTLHVDTGMLRLGFSARQLAAIDENDLAGLQLELLMSHLACADVPDHPLNEEQRDRFAAVRARFPGVRGSLANSAGIFLGPAWRHDLCRPGIALWGGNPVPGRPSPVRPVVTLTAPILAVHEVDAAGSVGYGADHPVAPGQRIATLPVGYADGILRAAGGRHVARLAGFATPLVGRISMDLITIDVTGVPEALARPGATVELIGGEGGIDRLAQAAGTIAYEVLTRLGGRLQRRYDARAGAPS